MIPSLEELDLCLYHCEKSCSEKTVLSATLASGNLKSTTSPELSSLRNELKRMMDAVLSYSHQETDEPTGSVSSPPVKLLVDKAEMHTQAYTSKAKRCHYDTPTRKYLQVMIPTGSSYHQQLLQVCN